MKAEAPVPSKTDLLLQMFAVQKRALAAMIEADRAARTGDLITARASYEEQIRLGKEHLALAVLHNEHHPPPTPLEPIVQPTVNAMLMLADALQSLGQREEAHHTRDEAAELSNAYLLPAARAETERSLATALAGEGRFNEALVSLMKCRDHLLQQREPIPLVRVTIDLVDILNWLGDHARAMDELKRASALLTSIPGGPAPGRDDLVRSAMQGVLDILAGTGTGQCAVDAVALRRATLEISYYQGLICRALQRYDEAESFFQSVLPEYQTLGVGAAIEFQLAAIAAARGEYHKALEISERIEPVFIADNRMQPKRAALLKLQADALGGLGDKKEALLRADGGIRELSSHHEPDLLWRLFLIKGRLLNKDGRHAEALEAFARGAEVVNQLRRTPLGYRLDSTYLRDKLPLFSR